jgi:hypothetical protein
MPNLFDVLHEPSEGLQHAEIEMSADIQAIVNQNLTPEERANAKGGELSRKDARTVAIVRLVAQFSALESPT